MKKKLRRGTLCILIVITLAIALSFLIRPTMASLYRDNVLPLKYTEEVYRYSSRYQVPPSVVFSVIKCESNFDPEAKSRAGAIGLMQIMPDTFNWLSRRCGGDYTPEQISQPGANIHVGVYYLSWLYERFGSWDLVYAGYNAGHNRVKNWQNEGILHNEKGQLQIPIRETAAYVEKVSVYREKYLEYYDELSAKEKEYERSKQ